MIPKKDWVWLAARILVGGIFAYAGFLKVIEPAENFQAAILEYQLVPYAWTRPLALILPWLELVFGVFLVLGFVPKLSGLGIAGLSLSFIGMIVLSYLKLGKLPESCGCFGEGISLAPWQVLLLDSACFYLGLRLSRLKSHPLSLNAFLQSK